jgi:hypothetical protein
MANEIGVSASIAASKGGATISASGTDTADMSGDQMIANVQSVGTSAEALQLGDVSTIGYLFLKNMDATNYVEVALDSAVSTQIFAKLLAGDVTLVKAATATLYAKANTAAVNLYVAATEL